MEVRKQKYTRFPLFAAVLMNRSAIILFKLRQHHNLEQLAPISPRLEMLILDCGDLLAVEYLRSIVQQLLQKQRASRRRTILSQEY